MKIFKVLSTLVFAVTVTNANAALLNFTGDIEYHNDVVYTYFTLANDTTDIDIWTDSFQEGTNFDPIMTLWDSAGNFIAENDDDDTINPATQTDYDAGFSSISLSAGDYFFTIATFDNFSDGSNISDGFLYDSETPIALEEWNQPANDVDMGPYWSVWLNGVDRANSTISSVVTPVPEPASLALFGLGLAGICFSRKKKTA